jgi:glycosyltransferase involved in cell wall biosynthesis
MRILKVTQCYYPYLETGGPAVKVRAIAERLASRGHRVTVLTANFGAPGPIPHGMGRDREARRGNGVEVVYLPTLARYRTLTLNPAALDFCRRRLSEYDLAHIYGLYDLLGPAVARFSRRRGLPYLVEPMGMFRPIVRSLRLKKFYHRWFGQPMLSGAGRILATSPEEADELAAGGIPRAKIAVRRNGVEAPAELPAPGTFRRRWGIEPATMLVLFLGRLVPKKSPDLLLRAFASSGNTEARLILAGPAEDAGYRRRLERLARELGLESRTLFPGPLYEEAKWAAYRDADVFVLPSQSENFGNSVAEAIVCGTPAIVTDRCGIASWVKGRAALVVPYELEALRAALAQVLADDALRARLRAGCTSLAGEFSWDEPIAAMEQLYGKLAAFQPSGVQRGAD